MSGTDRPIMDEQAIVAVAAMIRLVIPDACLPGVAANMALLADHAARLQDFALPDDPA